MVGQGITSNVVFCFVKTKTQQRFELPVSENIKISLFLYSCLLALLGTQSSKSFSDWVLILNTTPSQLLTWNSEFQVKPVSRNSEILLFSEAGSLNSCWVFLYAFQKTKHDVTWIYPVVDFGWSESKNKSFVVLDKLIFTILKPLLWKIRKIWLMDRQDRCIKSPCRRLKTWSELALRY